MTTPPVTASLPLSAADVFEARKRLAGVARLTPVLSHPVLDEIAGRGVACKVEALQRAGSFKFRGAYNAVASLNGEQRRGVIGASSGNHAQALALAGRLNGVPVTVVVPHDAPVSKVEGARSLGARIVTYHREQDDRDEMTADLAAREGLTIIPSANSPFIMAGAGTATLELLEQAPDLTTILVPVGGGGLAAGTAVAAKHVNPGIKVIGVEPETGADTAASLRAGQRAELPAVPQTIADGLRHTTPAPLPWEVNRALLDDVVTVSDDQILQAMHWSFANLKIVVEPSGAVALAAVGDPALPHGGSVGVIISGGSVDLSAYLQLMTRALP